MLNSFLFDTKEPSPPLAGNTAVFVLGIGHGIHRGFLDGVPLTPAS